MSRFTPPLGLASLSGESDAAWATAAADLVGFAVLGGIALDDPTRAAARQLVDRDRTEFLPETPKSFVDSQLAALGDEPLAAGFNVRAASPAPVAEVATVCRRRGAFVEINAHCRQDEMCTAGAGQMLLREPDRLAEQVSAAATAGATVSVKVRTEVDGVDLPALSADLEAAGADLLHVDAMDSEPVVAEVVDALDEASVIANNGVRGETSIREYLDYGADAVSVGRPSDDPVVLRRVRAALDRVTGEADEATEPDESNEADEAEERGVSP